MAFRAIEPGVVLAGRVASVDNEPAHSGGNAADEAAPDRADIALAPSETVDPKLLSWLAKSGPQSKAEITTKADKNVTTYTLSGITSRSISVTQSQDGAGQTSLVLGARHGSVDGVALN